MPARSAGTEHVTICPKDDVETVHDDPTVPTARNEEGIVNVVTEFSAAPP